MSGGLGRKGEETIECPFCGKGKVKMFHKEGYMQPRVERISNKSTTRYVMMPDMYEVLEKCPKCGKTKKEIQNRLDGKEGLTEEDRKKADERFKKQGLPTQIEF